MRVTVGPGESRLRMPDAAPAPGLPALERELARQGERLIVSRGPRVGDIHGPSRLVPGATFSPEPPSRRPATAGNAYKKPHAASWHANLYTQDAALENEWQGGQVHSRSSTPGAPLYYSSVTKDEAPKFSFDQHRQGKVYMPGAHEPSNDTYGTYTPDLPQRPSTSTVAGTARVRSDELDDVLQYHTSENSHEREGPRLQRESADARVWPEEGATIALQVFLCQRHEFAVTSAQCRADEAAVRKLIVDFLISRLDDKNALAVWDLGDRAASRALSHAAFEYVQRHLQVVVAASDAFWDLPFSHVLKLVTSDNLTLFNECQAVELLGQWVHVDDLRRAQPEVMRFKALVAELQSLRADVCPQLQLRLAEDQSVVEERKEVAELHRTAYAAAKQAVEAEVARLEQARANCETAKRRVTAVRKQLPKQKAMKLRFFNTEPPDVVRRVMCAVAVLLRIPGDYVGPAGPPSQAKTSPVRGRSRGRTGSLASDSPSRNSTAANQSTLLSCNTPVSARGGEQSPDASTVASRHSASPNTTGVSTRLSFSTSPLRGDSEYDDLSPRKTRAPFAQLSLKQALQLYNEPSLPGWLKQLDASKLTLEDCREVHRFTRARDYDPHVLKRRLGASKQELPVALASFCLAVEDFAIWRLRALDHEAAVAALEQGLAEATDRLCDSESLVERMEHRVRQTERELIQHAEEDALVDLRLELSFQRLVQGNAITLRRLLLLLNRVRWPMVPQGYVTSRLHEHPLIMRFRTRAELQAALERAAEIPRVSLCEASWQLKDAHGQRLVRATLASSLDADIASVLQRQSAAAPAGLPTSSDDFASAGGDRSGGYGGTRSKMIALSWSRRVLAHELRCEGDYGGFLGTTETGASVVVGPRPGSRAARAGNAGMQGHQLGDTVIYVVGGLGVDGVATRYVRMFEPNFGGGTWLECAPLVHPRAFAAAAFLPPPPQAHQHLPPNPTQPPQRPATTSSIRARSRSGKHPALRVSVSQVPPSVSKGPPARLVVVGGVSDTQRFLRTAEVLDLSDGGVKGADGVLGDYVGDTRREAEAWRMRLTIGGNGGGRSHSGQWELIGTLNTARSLAQVLVVEGSLYVAGGLSEDRMRVPTVERLRPSFARSWLRNNSDLSGRQRQEQRGGESVMDINLMPAKGGVFGDDADAQPRLLKSRPTSSKSVDFAVMDDFQASFVGVSNGRGAGGGAGSGHSPRLRGVEDDDDPILQPRPLPLSAGLQRPGGSAIDKVGPPRIHHSHTDSIRPWSGHAAGLTLGGVEGGSAARDALERPGGVKTWAKMQQERKAKEQAAKNQERELALASSYLAEEFGSANAHPRGAPLDLSCVFSAQEFGGGSGGGTMHLEGREDGEVYAGGVSTRGPRKQREELRHWNNPYWPYQDPNNTCTVRRLPTGDGGGADTFHAAKQEGERCLTLRAPSRVGRTPPPAIKDGESRGGHHPGQSHWWRNRTRFWSGRLRAAPAGNVQPFVTESELQQQKKRLKPVSLPSFQEFLSTRGGGGVLGGFGGAIAGNKAPGGQRWGKQAHEDAAKVSRAFGASTDSVNGNGLGKSIVVVDNVGDGSRRAMGTASTTVEALRHAARVGTPAMDRIIAMEGQGLEVGVIGGRHVTSRKPARRDEVCEHNRLRHQCKECSTWASMGSSGRLLQHVDSSGPAGSEMVRDWSKWRQQMALREEAADSLSASHRGAQALLRESTFSYWPVQAGPAGTTAAVVGARADQARAPTTDAVSALMPRKPGAATVSPWRAPGASRDVHADARVQEHPPSTAGAEAYRNEARRFLARGSNGRGPPALSDAGEIVGEWHPGSRKVHGSGTLSRGGRVMAPWRAEALAREHYFASARGSGQRLVSDAGTSRAADALNMSGQVARTLLFADQTWETIQSVQQPGGRQTQDQGTMQVVEYVLGRPWQTDYSALDPSVSFLISQGNRGRAGGSRVSSAARTRESASRQGEGGENCARARDVTMTFQPLLKTQAAQYESLASAPAAMEKIAPHPVFTPTPPPTGRTVRQLQDLAWGGRRGVGREAAMMEETERERRRREEEEERKARRRQERVDKIGKTRQEEGLAGDVDRVPVEEYRSGREAHALPPWGYVRHYYSFHIDCAIRIQALARGVESRKKLEAYKRLAAQDFSKVLRLHLAEIRAENAVRDVEGTEADGGGGGGGGAPHQVPEVPLSSVMRQLKKMGWGQPRLQRVRTAMGKKRQPGERDSGGQVGQYGFFKVVLHTYIFEAQARRERGGFFFPDEERRAPA